MILSVAFLCVSALSVIRGLMFVGSRTTNDASAKITILFNYLEDPCIATWNAVWRSIFAIFCAGVIASTLNEL